MTTTRRPITDMDLITSVIKVAIEPGYVLVGPSERVWRRHCDQPREIERVPDYEDTVVHQLLAGRLLSRGTVRDVTRGAHDGPATPVIVRRDAQRLAHRWAAYQRPGHAGQGAPR